MSAVLGLAASAFVDGSAGAGIGFARIDVEVGLFKRGLLGGVRLAEEVGRAMRRPERKRAQSDEGEGFADAH